MQVEDGVGDDAGSLLLVSSGCHHEYGDAPSPRSPKHNLVPLYDALEEEDGRKAGLSVYPRPHIALVTSLNFVRLLVEGSLSAPFLP